MEGEGGHGLRFDDTIALDTLFSSLPDWTRQLPTVASELFDIPFWVDPAKQERKRKVIHDPVYGTKQFEPWLMDIMDSYALQRLRQIRQLSLASLTFPSAEHSRFSHSVGVLARVQDIATQMGLGSGVNENVRAAALLHDIGHGPFSHLSEDAYRAFGWFDGIVGTKDSFFGVSTKPHEALGALLVMTEPAQRLFHRLNQAFNLQLDSRVIAAFITGAHPADKASAGLIVNGALDGDKLDYLLRDAYMSGLGISIDTDRWILAYEAQQSLRRLKLNATLSSRLPEQVSFGKWTLRSAVYYHNKVRAADISYMQWALAMADDPTAILGNVRVSSPVDFLRLTDADVLSSHTPATGSEKVDESPVVEILRRRLRRRDLPVKVEEYSKEDLAERGLIRLLGLADDRSLRPALIDGIRKACSEVARECGGETDFDVWFDLPETWTKDPTREYADMSLEDVNGTQSTGQPVGRRNADVSERVGEIFDDEKYRARLFAHPRIEGQVLARTNLLFQRLRESAQIN